MNAIDAHDLGTAVLEIVPDEDAESPRAWDNLGTMVCWHHRYNLGDKHDFASPDDFDEEITEKNALILPLYLYDHSGLALSTRRTYPFTDPWDAGQVGWIYVTKEKVRREWGVKRLTKAVREKALACLEGEVETYDQYLRGDIYGFVLSEKCPTCGETKDEIDSCWGFYGDDPLTNGMADHLSDEFRRALQACRR